MIRRFILGFGAAALLLGAVPAHALNRVTLRNGFAYDCAREQAVDATHTRLFLSAATDASFVDIPTADIVAIDALPSPSPGALSTVLTPAPPNSADIPSLLSSAGTKHNIDVALLASLVHAESSGRTHALSRAGAGGLMQLMPGTARDLGVTDRFAPEANINGGTAYLDALLTRYRDNLALALAAYNAGPAAVDRFHGVPPFPETRAYVIRVMTEFKRRKAALDHAPAPTLHASR